MGVFDNLSFEDSSQGELDLSLDEIISQDSNSNTEPNVEGNSTEQEPSEDGHNTEGTTKNKDTLNVSIEDIIGDDSTTESSPTQETEDVQSANTSNADSNFLLLGNALAEKGILNSFSEEKFKELLDKNNGDEGEALLDIINQQLDETEKAIKSEYDEEFATYMKLKDLGYDQNTAYELSSINANLSEITEDVLEESEDTRKEILEMHYKNTTKWSDERIAREIEKKVNAGEDIDEAKECLPEVQKAAKEAVETATKQAEQRNLEIQQQQEAAIKSIKESFNKEDEIVKGIKLSKVQRLKAQELLLSSVELEDGTVTNPLYAERAKDPIAFDKKLATLIAAGAFEGNVTTEKVATSKAIDKLNKAIKNTEKVYKGDNPVGNEVSKEELSEIDSKFINFMKKQ